ncbi:Transcription factor 24 [Sciurus carolinensis]|uniref:Transcription factor 24 n=1 Tax=Sciurus carolinensis TaxID=30640 RepID=A0AA41MWN7_SCICA|nr:Transcription factor 24 [Sciurus carolinensis]
MDRGRPANSPLSASAEPAPPGTFTRDSSPGRIGIGARSGGGRPAAANAARERSRVQTLRHAFLELQRTLPSVPPDTKLSKLDVLLLATTYIAHLTRSLQDDAEGPADPGLGALSGDGYLHPVKVGGQGALRGWDREEDTLSALSPSGQMPPSLHSSRWVRRPRPETTLTLRTQYKKLLNESLNLRGLNRSLLCPLQDSSSRIFAPLRKWPMRSRLYIGATGQFLKHSISEEKANHSNTPTDSQP